MDVRITNLDAPSNIHWKPEAVLLSHDRETKKKKHIQACLFLSGFIDGVLGKDAKEVLKNLTGSLAKKSEKSYFETSNVMKSRISIVVVRGKPHTYACIRGSRIPTMSRMNQHPQWEDGAGFSHH